MLLRPNPALSQPAEVCNSSSTKSRTSDRSSPPPIVYMGPSMDGSHMVIVRLCGAAGGSAWVGLR